MFCRVFSADICGIDASLITVEADVSGGLPAFNMVGLLSGEVKEARERVERAIVNSGLDFPSRRITINLSPANVRKQGSGFDLPIAVAVLTACGVISEDAVKDKLFIGELSLDGSINKVNGVLSIALMARKMGIGSIVIPSANAFEGAVVDGLGVFTAGSLNSLINGLNKGEMIEIAHVDLDAVLRANQERRSLDFGEVTGQEKAKRATAVAVAGFHNILYVGPPGSGKSMMARRIPTICQGLTRDECLEVSKIYSVAGLLKDNSMILTRPFRSPHQSVSPAALLGGMGNPRPGEITLAHKGVLFLDEISEFKRENVESLRLPMEHGKISINRLSRQVDFPCAFMLVAATNPCKCGYWPDRRHCKCTDSDVRRYLEKIKGPIIDRVDICVGISRVQMKDLSDDPGGMTSEKMRQMVETAGAAQSERFKGLAINFNSQMSKTEADTFCTLDGRSRDLLAKAYDKYNLSARGYYKVLKVARTIADIEGFADIRQEHILEAIGYRNSYISN